MFPEAYELTGSQQKHQIAEDDLRHAERYRALAVEVLAMDLSGGDDSNRRDEGNESFAAELARTFNEANERADEEQRLRGAESAAQWGDLPTGSDFSSDGSDDDIGDGTLRSATSHNPLKSFSGGSAMQQQHVCPSTFVVVEMAEMVGDRSPWLLQLLGRHGGIWGYLEGTKPNIGTMVVSNTSSSLNRAGARPSIAHLRALGSVLSLSMRTGTGARASIASPLGASAHDNFVLGGTTARRSRATSAVSTVDASPHREGTRMRSKSKVDILTVAAYKPENPHSYNVRLPDIIEHPVHSARAEATQREFLMASAVVGRMQRSPTVFFAFGQGGRTPQESSLSVPGTRNVKPHPAGNRDLFDADVIAKVLQQSGGSSSDLVAQRNQSARSHTPSATSNSQRSRKGADGAGPGQDDVADINYFHEDWELMMSGQGVYNDGSPKMLRLDVARKRKQQQAAAAAAAAAAKIPTPPAKVARPVLSASSSRRLSSTLDDETPPVVAPSTARRATIVAPPMSAPMSTPFLDSVRAYLGRASVRLEVGTRKAVEELERPLTPTSASTATPSLSDASPQPPREPNNEAKLLVARRPKSGMPSSSTTGTRCALLIPPSKSTAMTVPKSPRATSARTRQHS
ncbi:Hypothetical protein, putative [Bodo saltans]|uniref:Uncharacterized protein n=1 Tax=Bodo saltans TaxID=75058 RepID=A0A0S4J4R7_BODSA|nr:Hypothetical protein, putative [Bodo saltans]|eukprot:CUG80161.1 Hypothetical protein, putative [Bodo saltans]